MVLGLDGRRDVLLPPSRGRRRGVPGHDVVHAGKDGGLDARSLHDVRAVVPTVHRAQALPLARRAGRGRLHRDDRASGTHGRSAAAVGAPHRLAHRQHDAAARGVLHAAGARHGALPRRALFTSDRLDVGGSTRRRRSGSSRMYHEFSYDSGRRRGGRARARNAGLKRPDVSRSKLARLLLLMLLSVTPCIVAVDRAAAEGQWTTLPYLMPINPIHMALMNNGKVLIIAGSGYEARNTAYDAAVWDPQSGAIVRQRLGWDMFCNGMVVLPDGRVFINGRNLRYNPFLGEPRSAIYDPATARFTDVQNMAHGRWYPTATMLDDGSVMTFSGLSEIGLTNKAVEIYRVASGWSPEYDADWTPPLYPWMHLLPNGRVFVSGSAPNSRLFDPNTQTWSVGAVTNFGRMRRYGSSVLLPLDPAAGYAARVMIFGGGDPATASTELIDLSAPTPQWRYGPPMSQARIEMNATLLPNGRVLALGGSAVDEDATTASLNADLYDSDTNTFSSAGANAFPRLYHSNALLLPDGTVAVVGGNPTQGAYEPHIEIYPPAYVFNADGSLAARPTIAGVPGAIGYGGAF